MLIKTLTITVFLTVIIAFSGIMPVFASSQLEVTIDPNSDTAIAKMTYQRSVAIEYPDGGNVADLLKGKNNKISFTADSSTPGMKELISKLNSYIGLKGSQAQITDLNLEYLVTMTGRDNSASIDYKIVLRPVVENFVLRGYSVGSPALVDIDWRGFGADGPVTITTPQYGDVEINLPISVYECRWN